MEQSTGFLSMMRRYLLFEEAFHFSEILRNVFLFPSCGYENDKIPFNQTAYRQKRSPVAYAEPWDFGCKHVFWRYNPFPYAKNKSLNPTPWFDVYCGLVESPASYTIVWIFHECGMCELNVPSSHGIFIECIRRSVASNLDDYETIYFDELGMMRVCLRNVAALRDDSILNIANWAIYLFM